MSNPTTTRAAPRRSNRELWSGHAAPNVRTCKVSGPGVLDICARSQDADALGGAR